MFNFAKAIELDPENIPARLNLAKIYLDYLNYEDARLQYTTVVELQPDNVEALIGQGTALWGLGRAEETVTSYETAYSLDGKRTLLLERLGQLYEGPRGDTKQAIAYYKQYIDAEKLPKEHPLAQKIFLSENSNFDSMKGFDDMDGDDMDGDDMDGDGMDGDGMDGDDMEGEELEEANPPAEPETAPESGQAEAAPEEAPEADKQEASPEAQESSP